MNLPNLLKVGIGAFTGGVGGAAIGAASGSNTPLGRGLGMYGAGKSIGDKFSSEPPPLDKSFQSSDPSQSTLGNDYSMDGLGAMKRRRSMLGGF